MLDRDDAFRARVVDALAEGELDTAGELFLSRPSGWRDEIEAMAARRAALVGEQEERRREDSLRRELDRAEARLAELGEITREAAAETTRLSQELSDVRRARRTLAEELDAAVARLEVQEQGASESTRRAAQAEAALAVRARELSDARTRLEELKAELEQRPPAPADAAPTVDAGELARALGRLRVATVAVDAALASAEALVPAPEPVRPRQADGPGSPASTARRRPTPLPGGIRDDSAAAARYLLGVAGMTLLVDGYNVSMLVWPDIELPEQRDRLIARFEVLASRTGVDPVLVFDGASGHGPTAGRPRQQVRVRFSAPDVEADDEILELVEQLSVDQPVTVVSNDRRVIDGARQRGANVVTTTQLREIL